MFDHENKSLGCLQPPGAQIFCQIYRAALKHAFTGFSNLWSMLYLYCGICCDRSVVSLDWCSLSYQTVQVYASPHLVNSPIG